MIGYTYRIIVLVSVFCIGSIWMYLSIINKTMCVPPTEIQTYIVLLISGKFYQSMKENKDGSATNSN